MQKIIKAQMTNISQNWQNYKVTFSKKSYILFETFKIIEKI